MNSQKRIYVKMTSQKKKSGTSNEFEMKSLIGSNKQALNSTILNVS